MKSYSPVNHQNLPDTNFLVDGMVKTTEQATKPATPPAGTGGFYFKSDNLPYAMGDDGIERPLVTVTPAKHENPGFDGVWTSTAHGMKPPLWDDFWMAAGVVANSYDTTNFVSGGGSAKITQPATGAIVQTSLQSLNCFNVLPGDTVTISVWAKSDLAAPSLNIVLYTGTACNSAAPFGSGTVQGRAFNGTASWAQYSTSFTVPPGDTFARIAFRGDAVGAGSFWWDESGSTVVTPAPALLSWAKQPCVAATTANITISNPGTAVFDGVTLNVNDRLLVWKQSNEPENGIYLFKGSAVALARATDALTATDLAGAEVSVMAGTAHGGYRFGNRLKSTDVVSGGSGTPMRWSKGVSGDTGWLDMAAGGLLQTGWTNYGGGYMPSAYKRMGDTVKMRGVLLRATGAASNAILMPVGYRIPFPCNLPTRYFNGSAVAMGSFYVDPGGGLTPDQPVNSSTYDLGAIYYDIV